MACDINGSLSIAQLPANNVGVFKLWQAIFGKLCEINLHYDPMASCDINDAIARVGCCVDVSQFKMLQAIFGKLCEVRDAVTGNGGSGCCECFRATEGPVDWTPAADCDLALNIDLVSGTFSYYDNRPGVESWINLIV